MSCRKKMFSCIKRACTCVLKSSFQLHVSPTSSHTYTRSVVVSINMLFFFSFIVPVRCAICSEVWNCNKQGFTVCPHSVSAGGEQIFLIAQAGPLSFLLMRSTNKNTFYLFWQATLFYRTRFQCHLTALCHFLLPDSVADAIDSTCICLLVHYLMPAVRLCNTSLSWVQRGFILTALILCAVSHWWVMMVQFGEIGFD